MGWGPPRHALSGLPAAVFGIALDRRGDIVQRHGTDGNLGYPGVQATTVGVSSQVDLVQLSNGGFGLGYAFRTAGDGCLDGCYPHSAVSDLLQPVVQPCLVGVTT